MPRLDRLYFYDSDDSVRDFDGNHITSSRILSQINYIVFAGDVRRIGSQFSKLTGLKELTIPDHIESIDNDVWACARGCNAITVPAKFIHHITKYRQQLRIPDNTKIVCNDFLYNALIKNENISKNLKSNQYAKIDRTSFDAYVYALHRGLASGAYNALIPYRNAIKHDQEKKRVLRKLLDKVEPADYIYCLSSINNQFKESTINIPENTTYIDDHVFKDYKHLSAVNFNNTSNLTKIGQRAFSSCNRLSSIALPASVKDIGDRAFYRCQGLRTLTFHEDSCLQSIGTSAFLDCNKLSTITLPTSLKYIGQQAFSGCSNLQTIHVPCQFMGMDEKNYWSNRGIDPNITTIVYQDALYEALHTKPYNISKLKSVCGSAQFNVGQFKEYTRSLDTIQDQAYREEALELLLKSVSYSEPIAYYQALLKDPVTSNKKKLGIIKQLKQINNYEYGDLADDINACLQKALESDSIKDIIDLYKDDFGAVLSKLEAPFQEMTSLNYKFNTLHVDEDDKLHVLLPFARGAYGIITDNTCKATEELRLALDKKERSSVVRELFDLEAELTKNLQAFEKLGGFEDECLLTKNLLARISHLRESELYKYVIMDTDNGLPKKLRSIIKFPDEINGLLGNNKSNLFSIVLSPPIKDQDAYLRSADTAVCSFARAKKIKNVKEYVTDMHGHRIQQYSTRPIINESENSLFSDNIKLRLRNTVVTKKKTMKDSIKADVNPSEFDSMEPDPRILLALEMEDEKKKDRQKNKQMNINQCSVDLGKLENGEITIAQFMPLAQRYAPGDTGLIRLFQSNKENAITSMKNKIIAKNTQLLEAPLENTEPEDINKKAKEQTKIIYAVKKAYMQHMSVNEEDATERFEKVFKNDADLDLSDIDVILNTLHSPNVWLSYESSYEPFYNAINGFNTGTPTEDIAAEIDIAAQFFIGKLNVYFVTNGLTRRNFGKILDNPYNKDLRDLCIDTITECLSKGANVEEGLFNFISKYYFCFDLSKRPDIKDLASIQQSFSEQYSLIKDLKEKDEFFLYEESRFPTVIQHGHNICFSLSELAKTYYSKISLDSRLAQKLDDKDYHLEMASKFTELCSNLPNNYLPDVQDFYASDNDKIYKMKLLSLEKTDYRLNILRNCVYLPDTIRDSCSFYTMTRDCVQGMTNNEYQDFITLLGPVIDPKLLSVFPNGYKKELVPAINLKLPDNHHHDAMSSLLTEVTNLRTASKNDKSIKQKRILDKLKNPESKAHYKEIFAGIKNEYQPIENFTNPIVRWFVKMIRRYFSETKSIIITMRDNCDTADHQQLKDEMNAYLKQEYGINDTKSNKASQRKRDNKKS